MQTVLENLRNTMRHTSVLNRPWPGNDTGLNSPAGRLRVIILDNDEKLIQAVEDALWTWPRRISRAAHIEDVMSQCAEERPTAVLIGIDRNEVRKSQTLPALRRRLADTPIVAIASSDQTTDPGPFFELGADALLLREDACRPSLFALLQRIQRNSPATPHARRAPSLAAPWAHSRLFGALICDDAGQIVDSNRTLARWLNYRGREELVGRSFQRGVLVDVNDWQNWCQVAFDPDGLLRRKSPVLTATGKLTFLEMEAFASPVDPGYIQAVFVRSACTTASQAPRDG